MAWELRDGNWYYYRPHRCGNRVYREYIGTGPEAERAARVDAERRQQREACQAAWQQRKATIQESGYRMKAVRNQFEMISYAVLANLGCYWHRHSEWRISGGETKRRRKAS